MLTLHAADAGILFCADVVQHNMTAFLLEGRLEEWLNQLDALEARHGMVATVYPGLGPTAFIH